MVYITNAFSINMLTGSCFIEFKKLELEEVKELIAGTQIISAIGHTSTAEIVSKLLGIEIPAQRIEIKLDKPMIVFQLNTRLPEGKVLSEEEIKQLPHSWWLVRKI